MYGTAHGHVYDTGVSQALADTQPHFIGCHIIYHVN